MATWPTTLPAPRATGYAVNPADQVIRTEMEAGAPRSRRRTTARRDAVICEMNISDAQFAAFRTWFDSSSGADGGGAWFSVGLAIGETGITTVEARFSAVWTAAYVPYMRWEVSMQFEVRDA